jgi:TonB family protein
MLVWILLAITTVAARSQSVGDETKALSSAIVKHQRYLRGFSADAEVHWRWKDGALVADQPSAHMLSAVVARSVKVSGNKIAITADRYAVVRDKNTKLVVTPLNESVQVTVDLAGADIAAVLPHVEEALFFSDLNEALGALPAGYQHSVPPDLVPKAFSKSTLPECDCADAAAKKCGDPGSFQSTGTKPPKLIYATEPEFSDTARTKKLNGNVQSRLKIDASGNVTDVWIVRPLGFGLDQNAAKAVRQYRFAPASCHGQPLATELYIDTNFQIF